MVLELAPYGYSEVILVKKIDISRVIKNTTPDK